MASRKPPTDVDALVVQHAHPLTPALNRLRAAIRAADPRIVEEVKWNAPSYRVAEHFLTFQLRRPDRLTLIFHRGATAKAPKARPVVSDPHQLLEWLGTDRALVTFTDAKQTKALQALVRAWLAGVMKM